MTERQEQTPTEPEQNPGRRVPWWRRWRPDAQAEITTGGLTLTAGGFLAVAAAACWWFFVQEPKAEVPYVIGLNEPAAAERLRGEELIVRTVTKERSTLPEGVVVRSEPPAGTTLKDGDGVILFLAAPEGERPPPQTTDQRPVPTPERPTGGPMAPPDSRTVTIQPPPTTTTTRPPQRPTTTVPPTVQEPPVHLRRSVVIGRYNWVDLDNGAYSPSNGGDIYFGQDANSGAFHLQPMSPGGADEIGSVSPSHASCAKATTTGEEIALDGLPVGTVVCVWTDEARLSAVRITGTSEGPAGRNLHIDYTTWEVR